MQGASSTLPNTQADHNEVKAQAHDPKRQDLSYGEATQIPLAASMEVPLDEKSYDSLQALPLSSFYPQSIREQGLRFWYLTSDTLTLSRRAPGCDVLSISVLGGDHV